MASAQDVIHHGPSLQVSVQREGVVLPLARVNRLRAGDKLFVQPELETLAKGDWVLLLAQVSPTGNKVSSRYFSVQEMKGPAELEITAENQVPVIILAPQLRNLFGLYTSLSESANLLNEVLHADPQRFYDLQKVDQINQAIQALSDSLIRTVSGRKPLEAIQAAKDLAFKFGVRNLDPECFKNQLVNTECVATNIVTNKDFALPSNSDLSAMVGNKKALDLNSFLIANLRIFSEASDYLSNKYRDSYDFAPTFGRHQMQTQRIDLFSIARFRNGNIKTAYLYVPSWFSGAPPSLRLDSTRSSCFTRGQLEVKVLGRLPLINYWHGWRMDLRDPDTNEILGNITDIKFDQESGRFSFGIPGTNSWQRPVGKEINVAISGQFGFDPVQIDSVNMVLPWSDVSTAQTGIGKLTLISGEQVALQPQADPSTACLDDFALNQVDGSPLVRNTAKQPRLDIDLQNVPPGPLKLLVYQAGSDPLTIPVQVLQPKAKVQKVEHAEGEMSLTVHGQNLKRISHIALQGKGVCKPDFDWIADSPSHMRFMCEGDIRQNASLPSRAQVFHLNDEPEPIYAPLTPTAAIPRMTLVGNTPNALLVTPSEKSLQWNLDQSGVLIGEDSGLNLLLQAQPPYVLSKGSYLLQLRFKDDPETEARPIFAPLIADFPHNELRTRSPVRFDPARLPSVINPLEYRVLHKPSDQAGPWQTLGKSVIWLPDVQTASCSAQGDMLLLHGQRLDLIDAIQIPTGDTPSSEDFVTPKLVPCADGLCLSLPPVMPSKKILVRLRWVDDIVFNVRFPKLNKVCP